MKTTDKTLQIINSEPSLQDRLDLLVKHGFKVEASKLIRELARTHTAMFHYEWHERNFSQPLSRVTTDKTAAVYVMITTSTKLEYELSKGDRCIIFELGWERSVLGWTKDESDKLLDTILAQALVRPLNQWSLKQAEGTGRATRQLLTSCNPVAREIAALHLVYHLRRADFVHICGYLGDIQGFPYPGGVNEGPLDEEVIINWIVAQLLELNWTYTQIRKELAEWIWLKTNTSPKLLLAVAKTKVFTENDQVRAIAIRRWIIQGFDDLLNSLPFRTDNERMVEVYRQLFRLGQFNMADESQLIDKLVRQMACGKVKSVKLFLAEFSRTLGFVGVLSVIRNQAIEMANSVGDYGIAAALIEDGGMMPDRRLDDIVRIRALSIELE